jgi:hypothetical protein
MLLLNSYLQFWYFKQMQTATFNKHYQECTMFHMAKSVGFLRGKGLSEGVGTSKPPRTRSNRLSATEKCKEFLLHILPV